MALGTKVVLLLTCLALAACSGERKPQKDPSGLDGGSDAGPGIRPGDQVDVDGDGKPDGVAVDTDGDGVVDGVDTDNDGTVDEPLPLPSKRDSGVMVIPEDGSVPAPFPVDKNGAVLCGDAPCACSNGLDEDKDGLIDGADPECVAPWDNDEASFATGIPGDNRDEACQDCFFDGNSGSGNDGCRLPTSCLSTGMATNTTGNNCDTCEQPKQCVDFCKAYTPNGCDCFGCCAVRLADNTVKTFLLTPECDISGSQTENCTACVPNTNCVNTCGECELCPGKTIADLDPVKCASTTPPDADGGTNGGDGDGGTTTPPPPRPACEGGAQQCGAGLPACPTSSACTFGCCVLLPEIL